jgi:hypothetical protein
VSPDAGRSVVGVASAAVALLSVVGVAADVVSLVSIVFVPLFSSVKSLIGQADSFDI